SEVPATTQTPGTVGDSIAASSTVADWVRTSAATAFGAASRPIPSRVVRLPWRSRSIATVRLPAVASWAASSAAVVVLVLPPFGRATAYTAGAWSIVSVLPWWRGGQSPGPGWGPGELS